MTMGIAGCILSGGAGTRMGGRDKGLFPWQGRPMVEAVMERFQPQVDTLMISANRHLDRYRGYGLPVLSDTEAHYAGPLGGVERALAASPHPLVALVPCDAPLLPPDLVYRLHEALTAANADIAYATTPDGAQPVFCLLKKSLHDDLIRYLESGQRKVLGWFARWNAAAVSFDDEADAFVNANTPEILASCADDYDPESMTVEQARQAIHRFLKPVDAALRVPIRQALGRVLAEDLISPVDVPAHVNSAMDGYALRFADLEPTGATLLSVAGTALAGNPFEMPLPAGAAVRIMTGAVVPEGADTVVMQEQATREGERVVIASGQRAGQNIRQRGEDLRKGSPALKQGQRVGPAELGLMASLGFVEVPVFRTLRVAIFSTGDELVNVGLPLGPGQIYDSNRYTLYGMVTRLGFECLDLGSVPDDPARLEHAFREAAAMADVVISSGGVSVGDADFVRPMLDRLGEVLFWKIAMKPGRPLAYGRIGQSHFFGLPGNPVAVMVTFLAFVREALLKLAGVDPVPALPRLRVKTTTPLKKAPGRTEFQRGILSPDDSGEWTVRSTGNQGSGILSSMSAANCFIVLPQHSGSVAAGEWVDVQPFEGLV
jgi:molybdopterin molybdotransferase